MPKTDKVNGQIKVVVRNRPNTNEEHGNLVQNLDERILIFDPPQESNWSRSRSAGPGSVSKDGHSNSRLGLNTPNSAVRGSRAKSAEPNQSVCRKNGVPSNPLSKARGRSRHKEHKFVFDHVFNELSKQEDVYEETVQPLIDKVFDGYNCSCFCYGATGAGKTYTMSGTNTKPGIMYRAVNEIYDKIKAEKEKEFDVYVQFCEVYNERVHDLLVSKPVATQREEEKVAPEPKKVLKNSTKSNLSTNKRNARSTSANRKGATGLKKSAEPGPTKELKDKDKPEIELRPDLPVLEKNNQVMIQGLKRWRAPDSSQLMNLLSLGNKNRTQHATDANEQSSRSHAIFTIVVSQREKTAKINSTARMSKLVLVDLAGSERAAKVTIGRGISRLREGANINKSLLALGSVINALADMTKKGKNGSTGSKTGPTKNYVNYRNSKLTRIIKDVLGGNCFTVMIANVSSNDSNYEDTWNTLSYANRAKNIKASVTKSEFNVNASIAHYKDIATKQAEEIEELKVWGES